MGTRMKNGREPFMMECSFLALSGGAAVWRLFIVTLPLCDEGLVSPYQGAVDHKKPTIQPYIVCIDKQDEVTVRFVTEPIGEMPFSVKNSDFQPERNAASVIIFFRMFKIDCTFHSSAAEADL
jgi:hypothetical protein